MRRPGEPEYFVDGAAICTGRRSSVDGDGLNVVWGIRAATAAVAGAAVAGATATNRRGQDSCQEQ